MMSRHVFFIHFLFTMLVRNRFEIFEVASKYKFYIKFDFGSLLILPGGYFCYFFFFAELLLNLFNHLIGKQV